MKKIALKAIDWLKTSHHWHHLVGGMVIGMLANGWYCTELTGCGVAAALELKDKLHGGKWDMTDMMLTIVGANIGHALQRCLWAL